MTKRHLHHIWRRLRPLNSWIILGAAIAFGLVGVVALRQNNLQALKLRDAVIAADKVNEDVEKPLRELREFTYSHMNADLSSDTSLQHPVQLKYRYERLVAEEKQRVEKANEQIYTRAQAECEARFPASTSGGPRVPCIQNYVKNNGTTEQPIPDSLYKFDFVSPAWSADTAGISLLISALLFALFVIRYLLERWFKQQFSEHL